MKAMNNFGNNNRKQLEEQFKNKFENAQFSPPAHLWEQIDAALDEKPWYKRPLFYWTSGLVAALLLVIMFWFTLVYEGSNSSSTNDTVVNTNKNKVENTIQNKENRDNSINKNNFDVQTPNQTEVEKNNVEINSVQENEAVANSNTKPTTSNSSNKATNSTANTAKNNTDIAISIPLNKENKNEAQENIETTANTEKTAEATKLELELTEIKDIDWSKYLPVGNPYFEKIVVLKVDSTNETTTQNTETPIEEAKKSSGIALTFGINHTQGVYQPTFRTDSLYSGLTVIGAYTSNLADTLPQINISGTYQQTGFDVALQFGKNQRWSLNTGLGMGKANYSFGSTNYIIISDIAGNNLKAFPNNQVQVSYEWVQLPIAIGYQFGETKAKKFSGFAQLGTAIEFLNSYSYTSANPDFAYAIGNHRTTNTNVWTQVGINYHITNRLTLWGGGTYKSSLSSLINENGVTFSSQAYGWQVGTRFTIFNTGK